MSSISSSVGSTSSRISSQTRNAILASTQRSTLTALGLFNRSGTSTGDASNPFRSFIQKATAGFVQARSAASTSDGAISRGFIENVSKFRDSLEISDDAKEAASSAAVLVRSSELKVGEQQTNDGDLALSTVARELVRAGGSVRKEVSTDGAYTFQSGGLRGVLKKDDAGVTGEVKVGEDTIRFRVEGTVIRDFSVSDERVYDSAEYKQVEALLGGNLAETQQDLSGGTTGGGSGGSTGVVGSGGSSTTSGGSGATASSNSAQPVEENTTSGSSPTVAPASESVVTSQDADAKTVDLLKRLERAANEGDGSFTKTGESTYELSLNGTKVSLTARGDRLDAVASTVGASDSVNLRIRSADGQITFSSGSSDDQAKVKTFFRESFGVGESSTTAASTQPSAPSVAPTAPAPAGTTPTTLISVGSSGFKTNLEARVRSQGAVVIDNSRSKLEFEIGDDKYKLSFTGNKLRGEFKANGSGQQVNFTLDGTTLRFSSGGIADQTRIAQDFTSKFGVKVTNYTSNSLLGGLLLNVFG